MVFWFITRVCAVLCAATATHHRRLESGLQNLRKICTFSVQHNCSFEFPVYLGVKVVVYAALLMVTIPNWNSALEFHFDRFTREACAACGFFTPMAWLHPCVVFLTIFQFEPNNSVTTVRVCPTLSSRRNVRGDSDRRKEWGGVHKAPFPFTFC